MKEHKKKIGIMGGTFDPPHLGHLIAAQCVAEEFNLDKILFIPTGKKVYKPSYDVASDTARYDMVSLVIDSNPLFDISDIEIKNPQVNYTADTLEKLSLIYKDTVFYFIVGADSLDYMEKWHSPDRIFSNCVVAAVARSGYDYSAMNDKATELRHRYGGDIRFAQMPDIELSSTMIKNRLREGKSIRYMVLDSVYDYIRVNNLYMDS